MLRKKGELDERLDELEKINDLDLKRGAADETVKSCCFECINHDDIIGLQRLAHILFAGNKFLKNNEHLQVLAHLFCQQNNDIQTIADVMQIAFDSWKKEFQLSEKMTDEAKKTEKTVDQFWRGYSSYTEKLQEDSMVLVTSGTGFSHILKFLKNEENAGYVCDDYGRGIFCTPANIANASEILSSPSKQLLNFKKAMAASPRSSQYATRTPLQHFDVPVVIGAIIKAKHLIPTKNPYEVVVPEGKGHKLKSIILAILKPESDQLPIVTDFKIQNSYKANPELVERIIKILDPYLARVRIIENL